MWIDTEAEVGARMRDRVDDAQRCRLAAAARAGRARPRTLAGYARQVREAAGSGLVRTGLRLLDAGRV